MVAVYVLLFYLLFGMVCEEQEILCLVVGLVLVLLDMFMFFISKLYQTEEAIILCGEFRPG